MFKNIKKTMLLKAIDEGMLVILLYAILAATTAVLVWIAAHLPGLAFFLIIFLILGVFRLCSDEPGSIRPILWSLLLVCLSYLGSKIAWFLLALSSIWTLAFLFSTPRRRKLMACVVSAKTKVPDADEIRNLLTIGVSLAALVFALWAWRTGNINQYASLTASCYAGLYLARKGAESRGHQRGIGYFIVKQFGQLALIAALVITFGMLLTILLRHWQASIALRTLTMIGKGEEEAENLLDHTLKLSGPVVVFYLAALLSIRTWLERRRLNERIAVNMERLWKSTKPVLKGVEIAKYALTVALSFTFLSQVRHGPVEELRLIIKNDKQIYNDLRRKAQSALELAVQKALYQRSLESAPPQLKAAIHESNMVYASRRELDFRFDMEVSEGDLGELLATESGKTRQDSRALNSALIDALKAAPKLPPASDAREGSDYAVVTGVRLIAAGQAIDTAISSLVARIPHSLLEGTGEDFASKLMGLGLSPEPIYKNVSFLSRVTSAYPWIAELFNAMGDSVDDALLEKLKEKAEELAHLALEAPTTTTANAIATAADQLVPSVKIRSRQYDVDWARDSTRRIEELRTQTWNENTQLGVDVEESKRKHTGAARAKADEIANSFGEQLRLAERIHADFEKLKGKGYRGQSRELESNMEGAYQGLRGRRAPRTQYELDNLRGITSFWTHGIALALGQNAMLGYTLDPDLRQTYADEGRAIRRVEELLSPGGEPSRYKTDEPKPEFK